MDIANSFRIIHTPKENTRFEQYIIQDCCAEEKFISENNKSFSFDAFVGCSNRCTYCYMNRKPYLEHIINRTPQIKKALVNYEHGKQQILKEIQTFLPELKQYGLMTSFVTDPLLPEVLPTTTFLIETCHSQGIPLKILTKRTDWISSINIEKNTIWKDVISFGFTLTNVDEMEPQASPNQDRICALLHLTDLGFKTFCSIEPIINCEKSYMAIQDTFGRCEYYKIGLDSMRRYDSVQIKTFLRNIIELYNTPLTNRTYYPTMYIKDNVIECAGYNETDFFNFVAQLN